MGVEGGARSGTVWACLEGRKTNLLGTGVGLNGVSGGSDKGHNEMESGKDYGKGEHKNTHESNKSISVVESAAEVVKDTKPEEEGD